MIETIRLNNDLYKIISKLDKQDKIDLPWIVALGEQSAGKSSVIESIVGIDFLPKGVGIVTRVPLVIHLEKSDEDYHAFEFSHQDGEKLVDTKLVKAEIVARTNELVGVGKEVEDKPIFLTVHCPDRPTLTIIDLPGVTTVALHNQNKEIWKNIREMVTNYISSKDCLILAIIAANSDIATSDALNIAATVDPGRSRTLGVLTKIDIMDKGTNALEYLKGESYPLKLGYIGVKCRSQDDNNKKKSIRDALISEAKFFNSKDEYKAIASKQGIRYLCDKLNLLLQKHILDVLPEKEKIIRHRLEDTEERLEKLGKSLDFKNPNTAYEFWFKVIQQYSENFNYAMSHSVGNSEDNSEVGGIQINKIFKQVAGNELKEIDSVSTFSVNDILKELNNSYGINPGLFVPDETCRVVIRKAIDLIHKPYSKCASKVFNAIDSMITITMPETLKSKNKLMKFFKEEVQSHLEECYSRLKEMIEIDIDTDKAYINFDDDDFVRWKPFLIGGGALNLNGSCYLDHQYFIDKALIEKHNRLLELKNTLKNNRPNELAKLNIKEPKISGNDIEQITVVQRVSCAYFHCLQKQYKTNIPKRITKFIISDFLNELQIKLNLAVNKVEDLPSILEENPSIAEERTRLIKNKRVYTEAISELRDMHNRRKQIIKLEDDEELIIDIK